MHSILELPIIELNGQYWRYAGNDKYRYILECFNNPSKENNSLVCIGANSSTAIPGSLDPTLKTVDRVAKRFGYDGFIMLNLSPIRATNPKDLPLEEGVDMYNENIDWIESIICAYPTVYCAWGNLIEIRPYMNIFKDLRIPDNTIWLSRGPVSKKGHPHHPLYVKDDTPFVPFLIKEYAKTMKGR